MLRSLEFARQIIFVTQQSNALTLTQGLQTWGMCYLWCQAFIFEKSYFEICIVTHTALEGPLG